MYSITELFIVIGIIGVSTLFIRAIFLFSIPDFIDHPLVKRGMDAVPAAMLVALVIPFTFFLDQQLSIFRIEVYAILVTLPIPYITKKYSYGLVVAIITYILLLQI